MSELVFTLEDFHNPLLVKIYAGFVDFCGTLTVIGFLLLMYMVIKKSSPDMEEYRYYIIHQLCWSLIFNIHLVLWKPVPLWPFYFGYSAGPYSFLPEKYKYFPIIFLGFIAVGMGFSIYLSTMHRYVNVEPNSKFGEAFRRKIYMKFINFIIFCALLAGVCLPMYLHTDEFESAKEAVIKRAKFMEFFFVNYPSMAGYDSAINDNMSTVFMNALLLMLIGLLVSTFLLYANFLRILKKNQPNLGDIIYKMQMMLLKSWSIQISCAVGFLLLPTAISFTLAVFGIRWAAKFSLLAISINCTHAIIDYLSLCLCIQPYRNCLKKKIAFIFCNCGADCKRSAIDTYTSGTGNSMIPS
ncbi:hypothetical protein FO519_006638 [Halicephalobus sp. NKZ332]|nr:hypothetical protein FO519_006638 [Halicephalobus sp. NKZ332]